MTFPLRLPWIPALGSRPRPGPGGALYGTEAPCLPEIQIVGHRMIVGMSDWRVLPVFCGFSERCQWTSTIVCGVNERRRLRRKFMKTASALIYGN